VKDGLLGTGVPILPEGHPESEIFIVLQDISCSDPAEKQYYSCKNFDLICCRCGSTEPDAPVSKEMKRRVLKLSFHFDRLKLSSKTAFRKFLFHESYCSDDEKSLQGIVVFQEIFSLCSNLLLHIKSHV